MLTHNQARLIAEGEWGKGGTHSYPTNRRGAFYFGCSGHGGFVIDAATFTPEERALVQRYATPEKYTTYGTKLSWPGRKRWPLTTTSSVVKREGEYFLFEEDCAWCLPVLFAGITAGDTMTTTGAQSTFDQYFKEAA
jgi:hypothetical protein